jgi:hypothetical protein
MSFSYFTSYQSQGRYLFPSFLFIILLPIYGIYVLRAERLAFSFALALFVLCCDGIRLQFSYYLVNLSWEYAVYIATAMILLGIVLYDKYLQRIFYFSIISIAILIGVKFIYFSYMQNLYLMSDKQFSLPVYRVSYNENRFNIKIKQINDRPVINDIVTLEHQYPINNILPLKIETSGDNGLGFYLLYDNMVFHSIQSLTKFDAHEKKTELFFLINNFNYLPEVNFSLGMYGDNTFIRYGAFVARFQ